MRRLIIVWSFLFGVMNLYANGFDKLFFSQLTKADGLSDNNVECIFKDSDGFIWFGTRNGLCRYDGYEMRVFRHTLDTASISGNRVMDICEDREGYLWIGTYKNGLNKFDKKTEIFIHFGWSVGIGDRVNRIKVFKDGSIWVCSNNGLARYHKDDDKFTIYYPTYQNDSTILSNFIYDILETSRGEVYVAPEANVIQKLDVPTEKFIMVPYKRNPDLLSNYNKHLVEDNEGTIWISASYHGLCAYHPETGQSELYTAETNSLSTNVLMGDMALDGKNNLWVCTEGDGLNIFNIESKTFQHVKHVKNQKGSLSTNHTYTVYFDDDQIAWIGTFDKGIDKCDPYQQKFNRTLFSPGDLEVLAGSSVLDVFEDSKGRVWIGTDGAGLFRFEKGLPVKHYQHQENDKTSVLTTNVITALGETKNGQILIGTYAGGLIAFDPETDKSRFYFPQREYNGGLSATNVWEILTDSKNQVWLGMLGTAVDQFFPETGKFINYGPFAGNNRHIDFPNIMVELEDADGDIWFGSEGRGLYLLDNQTQKVLRIPSDTLFNVSTEGIIKSLLQDQWGYLWIGTEDKGLFRFDKKHNEFLRFGVEEGLQAGPIQSLQEDNMGNLWIGTSFGLYRYNTSNKTFNHFVLDDGLTSSDFNPDAMTKLSDGRIIAGTNNGADIINPNLIQLNQTLPKIIFTKLTVLNNEVLPGKKLNHRVILNQGITYTKSFTLTWKEKIFTLEFAALNYTLPQKCEYQYMLEGFDEDWVSASASRRVASYSNLKPGTYTFKVRASNNDGKWGNNEISLAIRVKPPFWNTLVFKLFLLLMVLAFIFWIYRRRINMHKERFRQQQLEQESKIIALEKEKLEAELKKLAFSVINKNKLLIEHKNKLLNLSNKAKVSVKEGLQKIVDSIDEDLDEEKDWKHIEPQIDKAYNQFITNLKAKHPDLTASEIRIAAYIRMNLTTKEICEFMNKTQRAVENDRYRLRKKIELDSNDSLQQYLLSI